MYPFCFTEEKSHTGWERHDDELTIPLSMEKSTFVRSNSE